MKDCNHCSLKKFFSKRFDLNWFDEEDCPFDCEVQEDDGRLRDSSVEEKECN